MSQTKEKINRASWNMMNAIKDTAVMSVEKAISSNQLVLDGKSLPSLLMLISKSIEAGYHKGYRFFDKEVTDALENNKK